MRAPSAAVLALLPALLPAPLPAPARAQGTEWALQVTGPDYELRHHDLGDGPFKPFLPTTSWRCFAGAPAARGGLVIRTLRCNYSVEPSGEFVTTISCGRGKPLGEALVDLRDERKNLAFKIRMLCRLREAPAAPAPPGPAP